MKLEERNGLRVLTADEGKLLSRTGDNGTLASIVYLGINDSPDNYSEIDIEELDN